MALHKLINPLKHYAWGSPDFIPRLLGRTPDPELPVAEMWMGAHPAAPSRLMIGSTETSLRDLIASDPERILGRGAQLASGELPFLLKVLAAHQPLSIQAHPSELQARLGWERENSLGLPLDSPCRNYRDPRPKPELICALTEFVALCGFRAYAKIALNLHNAGLDACLRSFAGFARHQNRNWFQKLALELISLRDTALDECLTALQGCLRGNSSLDPAIRGACGMLLHHYPRDPGVLAPLYLNLFTLQPGTALFLEAGVPHAYLHGAGIELMGNSDNVLRGGLTPKHVDIEELARILDFSPYAGGVLIPEAEGPFSAVYRSSAREFELRKMDLGGGWGLGYDAWRDPLIVFCGAGCATLSSEGGKLDLETGEAAFVTADSRDLRLNGCGELWLASLPDQN